MGGGKRERAPGNRVMENRQYQQQTIKSVLDHARKKHPSVCVVAPTGTGKTYMMVVPALTVASWRGMNNRAGAVIAIAHRRELIVQLYDAIVECGVQAGIIAPGYPRTDHLVQVASVQTLIARKELPPAVVCLWDECHHAVAPGYNEVFQAYTRMGVFHIGGTATPERGDAVGLHPTYRHIVVAGQRQKLIKQGYLVPTEVIAPRKMLRKGVADIPVKVWEKYTPNTRTIVFCRDTDHGKSVTAEFAARGWPTGYVDGEMDPKVRDLTIERFCQGKILVMVNCRILTEGFNLPEIGTVVLACPVGHVSLYLQMTGRAGRKAPNKKKGVCLDLCGNWRAHGFPDDNRKFKLKGRPIQLAVAANAPKRICPGCKTAWRSHKASCPRCGIRKPRTRGELKVMSERLVKLNSAKVRREQQEYFNICYDQARLNKKGMAWIERKFRAKFGISCADMKPTHLSYRRGA